MYVFAVMLPVTAFAQKPSKAAALCTKATQAMQSQDFGKALEWYRKAKLHGAGWLDEKIAKCAEKAANVEKHGSREG